MLGSSNWNSQFHKRPLKLLISPFPATRCRLTIKLATANTLIQEEYVLYYSNLPFFSKFGKTTASSGSYILFDFGAFVASVGGSMGLFLGLSFMDAVEWMKMLQRK